MQTIERSIDIDAPASTVWTVLTTPDYIGQWADALMGTPDRARMTRQTYRDAVKS